MLGLDLKHFLATALEEQRNQGLKDALVLAYDLADEKGTLNYGKLHRQVELALLKESEGVMTDRVNMSWNDWNSQLEKARADEREKVLSEVEKCIFVAHSDMSGNATYSVDWSKLNQMKARE